MLKKLADAWSAIKARFPIKWSVNPLTIILLVVVILLLLSMWHKKPVVNVKEWKTADPIKAVANVPTKPAAVQGGQVQVLDKATVTKKISDLPPDISEAENAQITATAELPPWEGKTDVVSVINTDTGKSEIIAKPQPLPFMSIEREIEIGARAGYVVNEGLTPSLGGSVYAEWDFLRIGKVHAGVYGELGYYPGRQDGKGEGKIMVQISGKL